MHDDWGPDCPSYELSDSRGAPAAGSSRGSAAAFRCAAALPSSWARSSWCSTAHLARRTGPSQSFRAVLAGRIRGLRLRHRGLVASDRAADGRSLLEDATLVVTVLRAHWRDGRSKPTRPAADARVCPLRLSDDRIAARCPRVMLAVSDGAHRGRMASTERYKGHDQLIEALPDLRRHVPDARLVFRRNR